MINKLGADRVQDLNERSKSNNDDEENVEIVPSRFIVSPSSYWNLIW